MNEELDILEQSGKRLRLYLSRKGEGAAETSELHLTERESTILIEKKRNKISPISLKKFSFFLTMFSENN
ncbi:hypothetical protein [Bacillus salipaludis]|uniref:Uncharacterized protein n=1 Tax=Bacillus salipaludis TaxID=2547811 RepID=A0ABW8RH39_9BACI